MVRVGEDPQNLSQYGSAGVLCIIIPLVVAALGIVMMNLKNKGKIIRIIGGLLIAVSCITIFFNGFILVDLYWILVTLELLAAITGIVLLSLQGKK